MIHSAQILTIVSALNAGAYDVPLTISDSAPFRAAVIAFYAASDNVQAAFYRDQCGADDHSSIGRDSLKTRRDRRSYERISIKLDSAFAASLGTDSAVEQVNRDFCRAADDR